MPTIQAFIERYTPMQIEMEPAGRNTKRESVRVLFVAPLRQSRVDMAEYGHSSPGPACSIIRKYLH
jgi:hypothetical protein